MIRGPQTSFLTLKKISKIKNGFISRQLSLAKLAIKSGASFMGNKDQDLKKKLRAGIEGQLEDIVHELGLMKGSIMKAGQMLSLHAGEFLPPEAREVLKKLENQTYYLEWDQIKGEIPQEWHEKLDIGHFPLAAASLGQVHMAKDKESKKAYAMKIQYKGVKKAIKQDVKALKYLLKMLNLLPADMDFSQVFDEIKRMLYQETDYCLELESTKKYHEKVKELNCYLVPRVLEEFSTDKILTTEYMDGWSVRSDEVMALSQESRNLLGQQFMELFFLEIFQWGMIQTDAHFGNYLISKEAHDPKWILLDFGATKNAQEGELKNYQKLMVSCATNNKEGFIALLKEMGYFKTINDEQRLLLESYCEIIHQPFKGGIYQWGESDIPEKVMNMSHDLISKLNVSSPPGNTVFIDRKIAGVFYLVKYLKSQFDPMELLKKYIDSSHQS